MAEGVFEAAGLDKAVRDTQRDDDENLPELHAAMRLVRVREIPDARQRAMRLDGGAHAQRRRGRPTASK